MAAAAAYAFSLNLFHLRKITRHPVMFLLPIVRPRTIQFIRVQGRRSRFKKASLAGWILKASDTYCFHLSLHARMAIDEV